MNRTLILDSLSHLQFKNGTDLNSRISAVVIRNGDIGFSIEVEEHELEEGNELRKHATRIIQQLTNSKVTIVLTSLSRAGRPYNNETQEAVSYTRQKSKVPGVKSIICVSSGKGGVGKSTISALIAQSLNNLNYKVGIVDADMYGPSIPKIFGIETVEPKLDNNKFIPIEAMGIKVMSIGLLIEQKSSLVWRGPMVSKAIHQLLLGTNWGTLDYLIIDMPPGTGDIHLSLLEKFAVDGVIIVTTPQELAVIDAAKAIDMYKKMDVAIIGVIENMSYVLLQGAKEPLKLFGEGGGEKLATMFKLPLLAYMPLDIKIANACDQGKNLSEIINIENALKAIEAKVKAT